MERAIKEITSTSCEKCKIHPKDKRSLLYCSHCLDEMYCKLRQAARRKT